jgi:hypothetical protein
VNVARLLTLAAVVTNPEAVGEDTPKDAFGDPTPAPADPLAFRGWYEQAQRSEDTAGADQQSEKWRVYLEPAAAGQVDGSASVAFAGVSFELDGPPWPATNPRTTQVTHVEATAKRVV